MPMTRQRTTAAPINTTNEMSARRACAMNRAATFRRRGMPPSPGDAHERAPGRARGPLRERRPPSRTNDDPERERHRQREGPEESAGDARHSSAKGKKMTIVDRLDPSSGGSTAPHREIIGEARSSSESEDRWMSSTTTIASSATRPIAAAMPPRVMRLIVWPDDARDPAGRSRRSPGIGRGRDRGHPHSSRR